MDEGANADDRPLVTAAEAGDGDRADVPAGQPSEVVQDLLRPEVTMRDRGLGEAVAPGDALDAVHQDDVVAVKQPAQS